MSSLSPELNDRFRFCTTRGGRFSLIELLVVLSVLLVVLSLLTPGFRDLVENSQRAICRNHLRSLDMVLSTYAESAWGHYPVAKGEVVSPGWHVTWLDHLYWMGLLEPISPWGNLDGSHVYTGSYLSSTPNYRHNTLPSLVCPSGSRDPSEPDLFNIYTGNHSYSGISRHPPGYEADKIGHVNFSYSANGHMGNIPVAKYKSPAQTSHFFDRYVKGRQIYTFEIESWHHPSTPNPTILTMARHSPGLTLWQGLVHVLFADGHVAALNLDDFDNGMPAVDHTGIFWRPE